MVVKRESNADYVLCENTSKTGLLVGKIPSIRLINHLLDIKEIKDFEKLIKVIHKLRDRLVTDLGCLI